MGVDISLVQMQEVSVAEQGITHNLVPLWKELGIYEYIYESEDKIARDIILPIQEATLKLSKDLPYYRKFDAPNGWGKAEHGLSFLRDFLQDLNEYPDATIKISR